MVNEWIRKGYVMIKLRKKAVLVSCFDWYEQRLIYVEDYLHQCGFEVLIVLSDFDHLYKVVNTKFSDKENVSYIHVPRYEKNLSVRRILSHYFFSKKVCDIIALIEPDLVYCLVPPNFLVKDVGKLKCKKGFRLVFDIIDMWPESFPKGNTNLLPFRIWKNIRNKYIDLADDVVLECNHYKNSFKKLVHEKKLHVFYLLKPHLKNIEFEVFDDKKIYLAYLGSINNLIDIKNIIMLIEKLKKIRPVVLKIIGDGESKEEFITEAGAAGAEVEHFGKIFEDEKKNKILGKCHFGLNIYKTNTNIGLTIKSIDYFQMGLPILNSIPGDTEKLVEKYGIGINLKDISEQKLNEYINDIENNKRKVNKVFDRFFDEKNIDKLLGFLK